MKITMKHLVWSVAIALLFISTTAFSHETGRYSRIGLTNQYWDNKNGEAVDPCGHSVKPSDCTNCHVTSTQSPTNAGVTPEKGKSDILPRAILQVKKPDLIIGGIAGPSYAKPGGAVKDIKVTVKNIGTAVAAGGFRIDIVLSTDTVAPVKPGTVSPTFVEDTLLGGGGSVITIIGDLAPGASRTTILSLNEGAIPKDTKLGMYYLCATADVMKTIAESNETNNTKCYRISIK